MPQFSLTHNIFIASLSGLYLKQSKILVVVTYKLHTHTWYFARGGGSGDTMGGFMKWVASLRQKTNNFGNGRFL